MGRERTWTGKLLHLLAAALIVAIPFGCAGTREAKEPPQVEVTTTVPEVPVTAVEEEEPEEAPPEEVTPVEESPEERKKREDTIKEERRRRQIAESLASAKKLLEQGDFDGSLKRGQRSLSLAGRSAPGDAALFTMALVYVHHKNPKKDYAKAIGLFERVPREFPDSDLADQARTWVDVLQVIEKLKKVDIDIEEKKKGLGR